MPTHSNRTRTTNKRTTTKYNRSGWGTTHGTSTRATGTRNTRNTRKTTTNAAPGYRNIYDSFECKVRSYKTLWDQTRGAAKHTRPTPATLKTFSTWINKGANVWRVTNTQINKWCKTNQQYKTGTSVKNALCKTFGKTTIKAVACDKKGGYIVATSPTWKGKPFHFPK